MGILTKTIVYKQLATRALANSTMKKSATNLKMAYIAMVTKLVAANKQQTCMSWGVQQGLPFLSLFRQDGNPCASQVLLACD